MVDRSIIQTKIMGPLQGLIIFLPLLFAKITRSIMEKDTTRKSYGRDSIGFCTEFRTPSLSFLLNPKGEEEHEQSTK